MKGGGDRGNGGDNGEKKRGKEKMGLGCQCFNQKSRLQSREGAGKITLITFP